MTSSESEGANTRPRKRSRTSNTAEDGGKDGKKARGRPRVDTQDATAADRRRTQIRLAQRAYRQRKETTISSLKQQSTQLHSIIEDMNRTFLRLNDSVLKSGLLQLNAGLVSELKHATESFSSLAKNASDIEIGDEEQAEVVEQGAESTLVAQQARKVASPTQENTDVVWGYSAIPDRTESNAHSIQPRIQPDNYFQNIHGAFGQSQAASLIPRRQFTLGEAWDQSKNAASGYQPQATPSSGSLPFGLLDILNQQQDSYPASNPQVFSLNIPTPDLTPPVTRLPTPPLHLPSLTNKTLTPVFTYSHDETTFARRLNRAALEAGFHLLSTANIRPSRLNFVFKLSLPYLTLEQLRARFRMMLSRSIHEDLDFWETPFIHLGGAGTHYPRKDANGHIVPKKNNWTVRQIGPVEKRMVRVENVADGRCEYLSDIDLTGFEGEWFDAYDVQGYLEEQWSCRLDPKSSFAECLVDDDGEDEQGFDMAGRRSSGESHSPPSLTHSSTNSSITSAGHEGSNTPPTTSYPVPDPPFGLDMSFAAPAFAPNHIDLSFDQTLGLDLAPGYDYGFPSNSGFNADMNLGMDLMSEVEVVPRQKKKKVAWLEVNMLIDDLIKHGVCLGRAPGFRRKDVDMALQRALVSTS
ncbi:hypothetical protein DE146DRAFT_144541 [Phaeosphaeria sp. MPI-PUGE-AT-0046c]|nr:hypothetical protein DE146DRAFT_144541 [Phaeosphaeria sp. MPI-PUGE-AT-0046c]